MESQTLGKEAFSALVEQHQGTARSILRNEQDVADAVQEAICLGYAARSNLRDPQRWKAWMLRILVNVCYTTCRRRPNAVDLEAVQEYLAAPAQDQTERLTLWEAVSRLPEQMRITVSLFYYEDLSVGQISRILKISQGAVRTRLSRARDQLRALLEEE